MGFRRLGDSSPESECTESSETIAEVFGELEGGGSFTPTHWVQWVAFTAGALAATALIAVAIPRLVDPVLQGLLPAGPSMMPWVRTAVVVGYILFVITAILPFVAFAAWTGLAQGRRRSYRRLAVWSPKVTILIPAYNEQEVVLEAVHSALAQDYPDFEVIAIDDGSTDLTTHLIASTSARLIRHPRNQGKAAALNTGLAAALGEIIVTCDSDSYLDPAAIRHLVEAMNEPGVGSVAGQVRLFHPVGPLRHFQVLEYGYSQGLIKRAQCATAATVLVAPGPVSAFRADLLRDLGGISSETLTEDFDLTLAVIGRGYRVVYEPRAIAYTEAPQTDGELRRQRIRWARGGIQVLRKHWHLVGGRQCGLLGLFWLPYTVVTWYATIPVALLLTAAIPLLAWGSGAPVRFLLGIAAYGFVAALVEMIKVVAGTMACSRRDLRSLIFAPLFVFYKMVRLDWFPIEAVYRECRGAPKHWS
jgi:cellulose synthase/poly-beta-1,6-N-acetylglucosamine synthase-like glycosyltransferase